MLKSGTCVGLLAAAVIVLAPQAQAREGSVAARQLSERLGRELSPVAVDENGWTDLHWAAVLDLPELAVTLLDAGASASAALKDDGELLGDRVKEVMRSFGHDTFAKTTRIGQTPLHLAARQDSASVARLLVERGSDIERKDRTEGKSDWAPLHYTAWFASAEVARVLLEHGAEPDTRSDTGHAPIHYAARKNASEVAQLLLDHGADVDAETGKGWTALHSAAEDKADEVAQLLINHGAAVNAGSETGWTPLHAAARPNTRELARLLIDQGAEVNAKSRKGWTPLHAAAKHDAGEVVRLLVERGAEVDAKTRKGWAPLHTAAQHDSSEVAQLLIDLGVDVDEAVPERGFTPLHIAAWNDAPEVVRLLVDRGADVLAESDKGHVPLDYAIQNDARGAAELLVNGPFPGDERSWAVNLARAVGHGGFPEAGRNLARLYEANAGDPWFDGPFWNEVAMASGWPPVPEDPLEAYDWFDRAVDAGFPATARKRELVAELGRASTERWTLSFFSAPEDELREEEELMAKAESGLCRFYFENRFDLARKALRNSSKRILGRELTMERAYRYIRCKQPSAENIDLIRVSAEVPGRTPASTQELVDYFVEEVTGGKFLLGKIVMCERDFGRGCLNVFEHIEKNRKESEGNDVRVEVLNYFKSLLDYNLDDEHLIHDRAFCRTFFEEPEDCGG